MYYTSTLSQTHKNACVKYDTLNREQAKQLFLTGEEVSGLHQKLEQIHYFLINDDSCKATLVGPPFKIRCSCSVKVCALQRKKSYLKRLGVRKLSR